MEKQTAVEWLIELMKTYNMTVSVHNTSHQNVIDFYKAIEQAKEMEKEQHNVTWKESRIVKVVDTYHEKKTSFDDYYSETFKK